MKILRGAEAEIIFEKDRVIKERVRKHYRLKELDEKIRKKRTRAEAKILEKVNKIIPSPELLRVDEKKAVIIEEKIPGKTLAETLSKETEKNKKDFSEKIGKNIAKMHEQDIIHGDLTTSNMIQHKKEVYFIDFGLAYISKKFEDRAVDLHVLKEALSAKHYSDAENLWKHIEKGYSIYTHAKTTLERLKKIESRGRYKEKY